MSNECIDKLVKDIDDNNIDVSSAVSKEQIGKKGNKNIKFAKWLEHEIQARKQYNSNQIVFHHIQDLLFSRLVRCYLPPSIQTMSKVLHEQKRNIIQSFRC